MNMNSVNQSIPSKEDYANMSREELIELCLSKREEESTKKEQKEVEKEKVHQRKMDICGWDVDGEGISAYSNTDLSIKVKKNLPAFIFEDVAVTKVDHIFAGVMKIARKIELKRTEGFFGEFWNSVGSILWNGNSSVYVQTLNQTLVSNYLLESSQIQHQHKPMAVEEIKNAFYQCRTITIYVPNDLSCQSYVEAGYESNMVRIAIESSKAVRTFFSK